MTPGSWKKYLVSPSQFFPTSFSFNWNSAAASGQTINEEFDPKTAAGGRARDFPKNGETRVFPKFKRWRVDEATTLARKS
jgi:hypothetical protein